MATTMRAAVFQGKGKIGLREVPRPEPGDRRGAHQGDADDDLRDRRPHPQGRVSRPRGPHRRPRAGRRHRGARARRDRLRRRRPRDRRRHHAVRPVPRVPVGLARRSAATAATATRRSAAGASATRSTAARPSTSWSRTRRPTSPRSPTACRTRTSCSAPTSCRPASRRRSAATCASATRSPCSRRGRSACARPPARGSPAPRSSSASTASRAASSSRSAWARTSCSTTRSRTSSPRSSGSPGGGVDVAIEALGTHGNVRERAARRPPGRHAVEPRRLLGPPHDAARRVRGGPRRPHHRHVALPGRQGADAAPHEHRRRQALPVPGARHAPVPLADIEAAYDLFSHQRDGVMKVAIRP